MGNCNRTVINLHVYLWEGKYYIPTVVKSDKGLWMECLPVYSGEISNKGEFADALVKAKVHDPKVDIAESWGADGKKVYTNAESLWSVCWREDGSLEINLMNHSSTVIDKETGDTLSGGWVPDKTKVYQLAGETPIIEIVEILLK